MIGRKIKYIQNILLSFSSIAIVFSPLSAVYAQITNPFQAGYTSGYARGCGHDDLAEGIRQDAITMANFKDSNDISPIMWDEAQFSAGITAGLNKAKKPLSCENSYSNLQTDAIRFRSYVQSIVSDL